jgi:hypothetical protein
MIGRVQILGAAALEDEGHAGQKAADRCLTRQTGCDAFDRLVREMARNIGLGVGILRHIDRLPLGA